MQRLPRVLIGMGLLLLLFGAMTTGVVEAMNPSQTIPTRTPTPGVQPTSTPSDGGAPTSTSSPPQATSTREPGATSTLPATSTGVPSVTPTLRPSPVGGVYVTGEPCSLAPTLQAIVGRINVRSGPGLEYSLVGEIAFLEVRPIIGRTEFDTWWQVTLVNGNIGWVTNDLVGVQGYTGNVPIIAPPALPSGETPTPGALWEPTPNPACTPPPTNIPTDTPPATQSPDPAAQPSDTATPTETVDTGDESDEVAGVEAVFVRAPQATATSVAPPTAVAELASSTSSSPIPTAAPLEVDTVLASSALPVDWLPLMGAAFMVVGVVVFFVRRR